MTVAERSTSRLAFFGRLADDLTRRPLRIEDMSVNLPGDPRPPLLKEDGHFVFVDLEPSAIDYQIRMGGAFYQTRTVAKKLPVPPPPLTFEQAQVTFAGEDELYLVLVGVSPPQNRISFEPLTFVPSIEVGATVIGEGGFIAILAEPVEGRNVNSAVLDTVAGLAAGRLLRIVRSRNLLLRPGPTYAFPADLTVVVLHVVENDPADPSIEDATVAIKEINGAVSKPAVTLGGLLLSQFALGGAPAASVVLDDEDLAVRSNERGDAVLYFPGEKAVTSVGVEVSKAQYQTAIVTINLTARARNFLKVPLTRL